VYDPLLITLLLVVLCVEIPLVEGLDWWSSVLRSSLDLFVTSSMDIVETLHGGKGGDVERWLEPQNISFVFAIDFLIALYCFTFLSCDISCVHFIIASISLLAFSVFTHLNKKAITRLNS